MKRTEDWNIMMFKGKDIEVEKHDKGKCPRGGKARTVEEVVKAIERGETVQKEVRKLNEVEIQESIKAKLEFFWENRQGQLVHDVVEEVEEVRMMEYLKTRDQYREKEGNDCRWEGTTYRLAADMWNKGRQNIGSRARKVRIMWDKRWTGERQAKVGSETPDICQPCGEVMSQKHVIEECRCTHIVRIRENARKEFIEYSHKQRGKDKSYNVLEVLSAMIARKGNASVWTGLWTPTTRERFEEKGGNQFTLNDEAYKKVVKGLQILAEAVGQMYEVNADAAELIETKNEVRGKRKRELGEQRTLEECGWKESQKSFEDGSRGVREEEANPMETEREEKKRKREDDNSQYDNG
jgi:hypothetical protein